MQKKKKKVLLLHHLECTVENCLSVNPTVVTSWWQPTAIPFLFSSSVLLDSDSIRHGNTIVPDKEVAGLGEKKKEEKKEPDGQINSNNPQKNRKEKPHRTS